MPQPNPDELIHYLKAARRRTLALVEGLSDSQLMGPKLAIVNPLLWEIGHVAWFHEHWILRHLDNRPPYYTHGDALYDSSAVAHDTRWDLPLPTLSETLDYMQWVEDRLVERLREQPVSQSDTYFYQLTSFHEDMHTEAFTYSRQTLGYPTPHLPDLATPSAAAGPWPDDVWVPGGSFRLGAERDQGFVFDNEKWAHEVNVAPFYIARAPVTCAEFAAFVSAGGYTDERYWDAPAWTWRCQSGCEAPIYWRRTDSGWEMRWFDRWLPLPDHAPVIHVNWYEAQAYCRWAGRRLPTEAEWEMAAACEPSEDGSRVAPRKRRYPWGDRPPTAAHANLDGHRLGPIDVADCAAGDSAFGCRQMLGNVWEWTASSFDPYPGFSPDAYAEYSQPWFGTRKVLRGGCWVTSQRMIWNTWRNFFTPERNDIYAGFRTCAI